MTAIAYSSPYWYATTADFRAWGLELTNTIQTAGLTKDTSITGQINWATVTAPLATNTVAGFEVYKFNDALQATAPVFIKLEYGISAAGLTVPQIWITVASAVLSNGTMTGTVSTRTPIGTPVGLSQQFRPLMTNICVLPGYVVVAHKRDMTNAAYYPNLAHFFLVCRTVDDAGANTPEGVMIITSYAPAVSVAYQGQCLGFSPSYVTAVHAGYGGMPFNMAQSNLGGNDLQLIKTFGVYPRMRPCPYALIYLRAEIPENTLVNVAMQGVTVNQYLALGLSASPAGWWSADTGRALAVMYQ